MGASLRVNLTQLGVNEASRTAEVNVEVIVTSTSGTHNHYTDTTNGATLYLTIDGNTQSFVATFGSEESGTFTTTLYFGSTTVNYNSSGTRTVTASARLMTGTKAGTISGSNSLALTPISSSGDSSGDSGGADNSEEYNGFGFIPSTGTAAKLEPGNATIWGQTDYYTSGGYQWGEYSESWAYLGADLDPTYGTTRYLPVVIGFTTPKFTGASKAVRVALSVTDGKLSEVPMSIALCRSDSNRDNYLGAGPDVSDENQIAVGSIPILGDSFCYTTIPVEDLKSETNYYLVLWHSNKTPITKFVLAGTEDNAIDIIFSDLSVVHIDDGSGHATHQCFIDNGAGWDLYDIFVDNGTSWDRITE